MPVEAHALDVHGVGLAKIHRPGGATEGDEGGAGDDERDAGDEAVLEPLADGGEVVAVFVAGVGDVEHDDHDGDGRDGEGAELGDGAGDPGAGGVGGFEGADIHEHQPEHADGDVDAVGAGQRVERGAEHVAAERQPEVHEVGELIDLAAEEDEAEEDGPEDHLAGGLDLALLARAHGERHEERGHQENEGGERRELDGENLERVGAIRSGMEAVDDVGRDQRAKEHAVRGEKGPHEELLVRNARHGGVIVVMIDGAGVSAHAEKETDLGFGSLAFGICRS